MVHQAKETNPDYTRNSSYAVDVAFDDASNTATIYNECVRPIVYSSLRGYHGSVFAYGQTATGKTHTMAGNRREPGIVPLAVHDCFNYIATKEVEDHRREFLLRVSYLEIYNEQINDLLHPGNSSGIKIFESKKDGVIIRGLKEEVVVSPEQVFALIAAGEAQRHVGATSMNEHSSRSHTIFRLLIESKSTAGNDNSKNNKSVRVSSLSLVDLAGSECIKQTGATGQRKSEGHYINKSLATLGHVVWKLSESSRTGVKEHIPYRDSKLTRLLQPSLSGNAQVAIVCTISPSVEHIDESHNTLKFATRAKRIKQQASVKEVVDESTLLEQYREEIESLKQRLRELESSSKNDRDSDVDGIQQTLEAAINNLQRLILRTRVGTRQDNTQTPNQESSSSENEKEDGKEDYDDGTLESELERLKGLLGSALKQNHSNGNKREVPRSNQLEISDASAAPKGSDAVFPETPERDEEVERLTSRLRKQEMTASLRKADSEFLQQKLQKKEQLLLSAVDVLDRLQVKVEELEQENAQLRSKIQEQADLLALHNIGC